MAEKHQLMEGVNVWKNGKNRFMVFETHYTADPSKRDASYIEGIRASMPIAQFRQEFELVWESFVGMTVYPDWNKHVHGAKSKRHALIGLPLLIGVDQGLHPAVVVCQLQEHTLVCLKEYTASNMGAERFSSHVRTQLLVDFPGWQRLDEDEDVIMGMDPTGFNRRDVDERTYAGAWKTAGFAPKPGENAWEKRRQAVERWLVKFRKGEPCFQVNLDECPVLAEGFDGGYRYQDGASELEPTRVKPIKDKYSQPHDALQYILTLLEKKSGKKVGKIPSPMYYNRQATAKAEIKGE